MNTTNTLRSILIVDDSLENLRILSKILTKKDYRVRAVKDGLDAVPIAKVELPDLILLNIKLPDINGYEVCARLKADNLTKDVPILFIGTSNEAEEKTCGFEAGEADFIAKPFIHEEVLTRVETYCQISRLRTQLKYQTAELNSANKQLQAETAERKKAENNLNEEMMRRAILCEQLPDGIVIVDPKTAGFIEFNTAAHTQLGYTREEFAKLSIGDVEAEGTQREIDATIARVMNEKRVDFETRQKTKDGEIKNVLVTAQYMDNSGHPVYHCLWRDITDHKINEEVRSENERKTKALLDAIPDLIFRVDREGTFLDYKADKSDLYVQSEQTIIGKKNRDITPPWFADLMNRYIQKALNSGKPQEFEYQMSVPKRGLRDYEARMVASGKDEVIAVVRDITDNKLAELKLKESEAKLTDAIKIAKLGTWEYNFALDRFTFNDHFYSLFHTTADQEGGYTMSSGHFAKRFVYLDDRVLVGKEIRKAFETSDPAYSSQMEYRVIYATGEKGYFAANIRIEKDADNRTIKARGVNQDITELKQTEEALRKNELQFRMVWENATDGMRITDETGVVLKANDAYCKLMEKARGEIEGKMMSVVYELAAQSEVLRKHCERFRNRSIPQNLNRDILLWNGEKISLELSNTFLDIPGQQTLALSIIRDVTEHARFEQEIQNRNDQLIKLNAEKDKFFSIIAHDLKSPFNGFLNLTELMADSTEEYSLAEFSENSQLLNESARNLYKLLENLLDWAQIQKGSINFTPKDSDLSMMVSQGIETIYQRALQKRIEVINEIDTTQNVYADEKMISTVLRNLLSNAVKFTRMDGRTIIKSELSDDGQIKVSVEDNGVGIPEKDIKRLFKIEEKVSSKGTDGESSTGLGLLLCKEFIEMNGGKIWAESEEGKGSKFYFTLQESK